METKPPIPRAILVGVQVAGVDDVAHAASIEELGLLVKTLGYRAVGTISQNAPGRSPRSPAGRAAADRWRYNGSRRPASVLRMPTARNRPPGKLSLIRRRSR